MQGVPLRRPASAAARRACTRGDRRRRGARAQGSRPGVPVTWVPAVGCAPGCHLYRPGGAAVIARRRGPLPGLRSARPWPCEDPHGRHLISSPGTCFRASEPVPQPETELDLEFELYPHGEVRARAVVRQVHGWTPGWPEVGVEFADVSGESQRALLFFLRERGAGPVRCVSGRSGARPGNFFPGLFAWRFPPRPSRGRRRCWLHPPWRLARSAPLSRPCGR